MRTRKIKCSYNDIPVKINTDTMEIKEFFAAQPKVADGEKVLLWLISEKKITDLELRVLVMMILKSDSETNSLKPLNDNYSITEFASEFNINRNKVTPLLKKFYDLGIYRKFSIVDRYHPKTQYWILNPVVCYKPKFIDDAIFDLFHDSPINCKFAKPVNHDKLEQIKQMYPDEDNIYILEHLTSDSKLFKIGYSYNLSNRIKSYLASNPSIKVIKTFKVDDPKGFEAILHRNYLASYKREWYDLETMKKINEDYSFGLNL